MTRRSTRRPAPKKQDESNVYYDDELSDVFEDPIDDNDDDSDEDPTFEADDDAFEDPSYDEPLEEEEEDDAPLSLGAKRKANPAFSSNDFSSHPSKLQRTYNTDAGWTSTPQPHVPHSMSASFRLNTPTPPMQAGRPNSYFAPSNSASSSYSSPGGGSGASITSCPPPLSQPNPSMPQQAYQQQGQSSYPGSSFSSNPGENRSGQGSGGYPYRSPLQGGRAPTAQQQHAASAYAAYSNRNVGGYPQMGSQQHTNRTNYPPPMNSSYGGGYPNSGYPPQQQQQQQPQNPRFNGAGGQPPVPHPAEYRVRELLNDHHNRSKVQGIPHEVSLAQLKREISNDPELIEALKLIRLRASQRGAMQPRPGMPFGQNTPPSGMHRTFGSNMYGPGQMQSSSSGQGGEMSNATIPASMRNAMSANRFHSSYGVPAQNYQVSGGMGMPMHGQAPQMSHYGQSQQHGYGQYGQPSTMMTSPMVKQTLNAEMANSLMQQTAGSGPDSSNGLDASTDNASQQEDLDNLSGTEKRIETIMRKCEGISRQLRESLQKHLKSLLDDGKTDGDSEEGGDGDDSKTGQPLSTVSMESILRSSTDTLQKSKEEKEAAAANGKTETSTLDEDLEQAMEENKSEADHADYYIVREQPSILRFALKEYQLVGLNWLNLLHLENVNGILADEMGLGKTIQTISLFALLHERKTSKHPHIVICPVTTLTNWMRELQKWCPNLRVIAYYGKKAERDEARKIIGNEHFDVIITTYNTAAQKSDRLFLKRNKFDYVVLDEAQNIKNNQSLRHKYLAKLDSRNRLLLTGTPLQNNLEELWALLQFIMPDLFSSEVNLEEETDKELAERMVSRMKVIMAPFVLRRLKQHVSQDLPAKELKIIECPMTDLQRDLYRACVQQSKTWWQRNQSTDPTAAAKEEPEEEEEAYHKSTIDTDSFLSEDVVGTKTTPDSTTNATETASTATTAVIKSEDSTTEQPDLVPKKEEPSAEVKTEGADEFMPEDEGESSDDEVPDEEDEAYTGTKSKVALPASSRKTRSRSLQSDDEDDELQLMRGTPASSVSSMNNIFMQLRKISNHPLLVRAFYTDEQVVEIARYLSSLDDYRKQTVDRIFEDLQEYSDFRIHQLCKDKEPLSKFLLNNEKLESCGKALQLKAVLADLKQNGHRVLLFSQMTRVLSILEDLITMWGYQYVRLDGNTPVTERQVLIDRYNDEPDTLFIFLLSTRAGGVGINLTSADTVIFYDIAFNPQVDRQAEDRCHRLGQNKEVTIYKMITTETVDEHMLRMADRKAQLNDVMLEEGSKKKDNTKVWALRSLLSSVFE